jgi:ATP-binding cassette subfamily C protein
MTGNTPVDSGAAPDQQLLPVASTRDTRIAALRLLRRSPMRLVLTVATLLAASASSLAMPAILGLMVNIVIDADAATAGDAVEDLLWSAAALVAAATAGAALGYLGTVLLVGLAETALADLREDVMVVALSLPLADLERAGTGDVVSRVSTDVEVVKEAVGGVLPAFTSAAFTIVLTVTAMGVLDWRFAVAAMLPLPIQLLTARWFVQRSGPIYAAQRSTEALRAQHLLETVDGAGTALALGIERERAELVERSSLRAVGMSIRAMELVTRFYNRLNGAELLGLSAVLAVGFFLVDAGAATVGAATAAALYFHRLFDPIGVVLSEIDELAKAGAGLARLFGVTQVARPAHRIPDLDPVVTAGAGAGSVELREVSYRYGDGRRALDRVTLTVRRGEHVALVGASGAGKTTVARLVAGILAAESGSVLVGGDDVAGLPIGALRDRLALVSQEPWAFLGTLGDDLRLADAAASEPALWAALDLVGADWARRLPDGLATETGAGGAPLAVGQVQQLALARLVLRDVPIVVLDEATAEAGTADAEVLDRAAARAIRGRTAISVAHRLSQAALADRVVVLEGGRIVEQGRHADLVDTDGTYARLWAAWAAHR